MTLRRIYCAFVVFVCASAVGAEPVASPSQPPTASASPAATITQSVTELSAQRATAERSKIYRAGAAHGRWLDQVAKDSRNTFLQQMVFDRVFRPARLFLAGALTDIFYAGSSRS